MTNVQAAIGCAQLERADILLKERENLFKMYVDALGGAPNIKLNSTASWAHNTYWMVCAEIEGFDRSRRDRLIVQLKERGVDTRPYFYPMSDMPYFITAHTPVAHAAAEVGINLPTYIGLSELDISYIIEQLTNVVIELSPRTKYF